MKPYLTLKRSVTLTFLFVIITLVVGYTFLARTYFIAGMDNIVASNMALAARSTIEPNRVHESIYAVTATQSWQAQPEEIRHAFPAEPIQTDTLYKHRRKENRSMLFVLKREIGGETWFISSRSSLPKMSRLLGDNVRHSMYALLYIALGIGLVVVAIVWWSLRRISNPIAAMNQWTKSLNENNLNQPVPDFVFPELNDFATLVHQSLCSAKSGIEREEQLLRQTSHELRTPISVIRSNVELAQKMQNSDHSQDIDSNILGRIDRASLTMKQMTDTLLWLNKGDTRPIEAQPLQLETVIRDIIDPLQYLLQGKKVALNVSLEPATLSLPEAAVRIVVGNLVRNAFQHTQEGEVEITLAGETVVISNRESAPDESPDDLGFGLGLKLTEQLVDKLGWSCVTQVQHGLYRVVLKFL